MHLGDGFSVHGRTLERRWSGNHIGIRHIGCADTAGPRGFLCGRDRHPGKVKQCVVVLVQAFHRRIGAVESHVVRVIDPDQSLAGSRLRQRSVALPAIGRSRRNRIIIIVADIGRDLGGVGTEDADTVA